MLSICPSSNGQNSQVTESIFDLPTKIVSGIMTTALGGWLTASQTAQSYDLYYTCGGVILITGGCIYLVYRCYQVQQRANVVIQERANVHDLELGVVQARHNLDEITQLRKDADSLSSTATRVAKLVQKVDP